tara:strand:+ start:1560 stop:2327 length:768 start_codon:yes stop_codon:yes gene_type:complete
MKKLTTIFGILFFVSVIFASCNKDKKDDKQNNETKTKTEIEKPKTEIEKDAMIMGDMVCELTTVANDAMKMEKDFEAMLEKNDTTKLQKMVEDFEDIEVKMDNLVNDMETFSQDMKEKYDGMEDEFTKAKEFVSAFTKYSEKCKDKIESVYGWDNFIQQMEEEMLSGFDEDGNSIKDENNMEISNMQSDAMEMADCYCTIMELSLKMDGEYDEETAMELEAVSDYCEELSNELEPIYSGNQEFMQLMEEFSKDCQ